MYIDGVILFSLTVIALIFGMMGYIGVYAYRHIKKDIADAKASKKNTDKSSNKLNGLA